jgi:hypothetical protein
VRRDRTAAWAEAGGLDPLDHAGRWPTDAELNDAMENAPPLPEPTEEEIDEMARYFGQE